MQRWHQALEQNLPYSSSESLVVKLGHSLELAREFFFLILPRFFSRDTNLSGSGMIWVFGFL